MKKSIFSLFLILSLFLNGCFVTSAIETKTNRQMEMQIRSTFVSLVMTREDYTDGDLNGHIKESEMNHRVYCSGEFINPEYILTAAHCIYGSDGSMSGQLKQMFMDIGYSDGVPDSVFLNQKRKFVSIYEKNSDGIKSYKFATIVKMNSNKDLALLKVDDKSKRYKFLELGKFNSLVGDVVYSMGNPGGMRNVFRKQMINQINLKIALFKEATFSLTSPETGPGESGGPLVNENGDLVGVLSGGWDAYKLNAYVNLNSIIQFIQEEQKMGEFDPIIYMPPTSPNIAFANL